MLLIEDIYYSTVIEVSPGSLLIHSPALGMTQARSSDQSPKADTEPEEVVRDEPELTGGRQPSLALTVRRGGQSKTPSLAISATWNLIQGLKCVKNGMKEEMKRQNFPWFFISGVSNFLFAVGHTSQDAWWLQDDQLVQMI